MKHIQSMADSLQGAGSTNATAARSGGPDQSLSTPRAASVRDTAVPPHHFGLTPFSGHTSTINNFELYSLCMLFIQYC